VSIIENYLDPDMAYVLGLIIARGSLYSGSGGNKIVIEFPFRNLEAIGQTRSYNQKEQMEHSLHQIRERIDEISEARVSVPLLQQKLNVPVQCIQWGHPNTREPYIRVDITVVIATAKTAQLVFIECKTTPITLKDISQLLGYSKVALPLSSLIISPSGISRSVDHLLNVYRRFDTLEYARNRFLIIALWNPTRKELDVKTIIPKGSVLFPDW